MKECKNQILVADKVFITPEFKVKKKAYKWNFILSIFLVTCLFSYYIYAEYDKSKSEEVAKELITEVAIEENVDLASTAILRTEDNIIRVVLDFGIEDTTNNQIPEINVEDIQDSTSETTKTKMSTSIRTASDGTKYETIGVIDIPKISVHYPIIAPINRALEDYTAILKISPCFYWGPELNEVGNVCILGHNYRNKKFFSKVPTLQIGDIIKITDTSDRVITYKLYKKYIVDPSDQECTGQNTNGNKEVTLITCTNDSKQRHILKFREVV